MQTEHKEKAETFPMSAAMWRDQRLIAAELRRQREAAGLTRAQLAAKMGEPYTAEDITQYEESSDIPLELWPTLDMVQALGISLDDISPKILLAKQSTDSGYADLNAESRKVVDGVIAAVLKGQNL